MPRLPRLFPKTRENLRIVRAFEKEYKMKPRFHQSLSSLPKRAAMVRTIRKLHDETHLFSQRLDSIATKIGIPYFFVNGKRPAHAPTARDCLFLSCYRILGSNEPGKEAFQTHDSDGIANGKMTVEYDPHSGKVSMIMRLNRLPVPAKWEGIISPPLLREINDHFQNENRLHEYYTLYRQFWAPAPPKKKAH